MAKTRKVSDERLPESIAADIASMVLNKDRKVREQVADRLVYTILAAIEEAAKRQPQQPKYPDFNDLVMTCPHGAVWCGLCITEKTAWYGAQR